MDWYVAFEIEAILKQDDFEQKIEHADPRPRATPNTLEGKDNKMDDAEDLECAQGSSSDLRIASPVRPQRPDILTDAPNGKAETRIQTPVRQKTTKRSDTVSSTPCDAVKPMANAKDILAKPMAGPSSSAQCDGCLMPSEPMLGMTQVSAQAKNTNCANSLITSVESVLRLAPRARTA